jgi:transcriptional regulator with XRE-family HTH domain
MVGIGKRIKMLREEKELSLNMFVTDINTKFPDAKIDKSMISRWENEVNEPSLEKAKYLSLYYDVSLDYLIGLTDVRTPSRLLALRK